MNNINNPIINVDREIATGTTNLFELIYTHIRDIKFWGIK